MIILLTEHQYFKMNADQLFKSYANIYTRVYKADNAYKVWKKKDNARKEKVNVRIDKKELKYAKNLGGIVVLKEYSVCIAKIEC